MLGDAVDGSLWQADTQAAGIGTCAAGEVGDYHRIIHLIDTQLLEEGVDVRKILLRDVAHLNLLLLGEANHVVAIVAQVFGYLGEEIGRVVAVLQRDVGVPKVLLQSLSIGLLVGVTLLPNLKGLTIVMKRSEGWLVMLQWQCWCIEIH